MITSNGFKVSKRKLKGLLQNTEKSAEVIHLVYVLTKIPVLRVKKWGEFYLYKKW